MARYQRHATPQARRLRPGQIPGMWPWRGPWYWLRPPRCGPAVLLGALARGARPRPEAQWVIVPNVTSGDQIVCQMIPEAGSVAETMWFPPS